MQKAVKWISRKNCLFCRTELKLKQLNEKPVLECEKCKLVYDAELVGGEYHFVTPVELKLRRVRNELRNNSVYNPFLKEEEK